MENVIIESTYDNLNIAMSKYIVDNAKANILIIHGMIEHRMRYDDFAKYLNKHNYNVYTYDKRGHGESINDYIPHGYFSDLEGKDALLSDILFYVFVIVISKMHCNFNNITFTFTHFELI